VQRYPSVAIKAQRNSIHQTPIPNSQKPKAMASLLIAASYLTYNKIKDKRAAKKEAKRKGYEARYKELEREHSQYQEKHVRAQQAGPSQGMEQCTPAAMAEAPSQQVVAERRRRSSGESGRTSTGSRDDDASAWVNDVSKEREKRGGLGQS
jgi:hypothetical protein